MSQRRRIVDDELYCRFVTFSCALRRRLLNPDATKRIVLGVLNDQLARDSAKRLRLRRDAGPIQLRRVQRLFLSVSPS